MFPNDEAHHYDCSTAPLEPAPVLVLAVVSTLPPVRLWGLGGVAPTILLTGPTEPYPGLAMRFARV